LRDEGVAHGQTESERMIAEARVKSMEILDKARSESESMLAAARAEATSIVENGKQALRMASRDTVLQLREACNQQFRSQLKQLVRHKLSDPKLLEQMIVQIAAKARPDDSAQQVKVLLPQGSVSQEELKKEIANPQPGSLSAFVLGLTADILRDGLTFELSDEPSPGVRVQIVEDDVQLDLTDETITAVLMQYLVPRFQAVLKKDS
jgi:V/A-type H+-transporting ATPase subunit E